MMFHPLKATIKGLKRVKGGKEWMDISGAVNRSNRWYNIPDIQESYEKSDN